jgi:hypothetical protein
MPLLNLFGGSSSRNYGAKLTELFTVVNLASDTILSNQSYSVTPFSASKGCGGIVYTISPTLPTGLSINSSTGVISGTPTKLIAATDFTITARDRCGATAESTFNLTVYSETQATVGPAIDGSTLVDLTSLTLPSCGSWLITPDNDSTANVQMWGGGGGASKNYPVPAPGFPPAPAPLGIGGGGGYSRGSITFLSGVEYQFIVGCGGQGNSSPAGRAGGYGGGGTGIQITSGNVAILVAGGGGGSGYSGERDVWGGNGGGTTGSGGLYTGVGGSGGSQTAAGPGGIGGRRTGSPGNNRDGGKGAPVPFSAPTYGGGGAGFGTGGAGAVFFDDAGGGGGGGGYWGGGGGGGDTDGAAGGGGSGYYNPAYVTNAVLTGGVGSSPSRGTAGTGGLNGNSGSPGKIILTTSPI